MTKLKLNITGIEIEYEGSEKFLQTRILPFLESFLKSNNEEIKRNLLILHEELQQNLAALESYAAGISRISEELAARLKQFLAKSTAFIETIKTHPGDQAGLSGALRDLQELQMSFNLQYLQLQNQMQQENRQFTMVSNIMKIKHDTAKNSISNIR